MNLTVPSFRPALPFTPVAVVGIPVVGDLMSFRCGSRGLMGDDLLDDLLSLIPFVGLTPLVVAVAFLFRWFV